MHSHRDLILNGTGPRLKDESSRGDRTDSRFLRNVYVFFGDHGNSLQFHTLSLLNCFEPDEEMSPEI